MLYSTPKLLIRSVTTEYEVIEKIELHLARFRFQKMLSANEDGYMYVLDNHNWRNIYIRKTCSLWERYCTYKRVFFQMHSPREGD